MAGPSSTGGRVVKRKKEAGKASAFLERWLQAGGTTKDSSQEQGRAIGGGDRWVGSGRKEGPQVRGGMETIAGKKREGVGGEGTEVGQESIRDRVWAATTT